MGTASGENLTNFMDKSRNNNRCGIALFGAGRIGSVHLTNLRSCQRIKLCYIVEEDVSRAVSLLEQHGLEDRVKVMTVSQADTVLQDQEVDAVMICTPSFTHESLVKKALQAGKGVFCEKPLAPSLEATQSCYELAEKMGKPLFCAFNRRWDPQVRKLRDLVKGGDLGQLRVVKSVSRDPPGMATLEYIKASGGIFIDSAVHDMDLLCWIVGEKPQSVYATGHATIPMYAECGDVDTCHIILKFPCGVVGTIEVSREAPVGYFQYIEALGSKGLVHTDQMRTLQLKHWNLDGLKQEPIVGMIDRYRDSYAAELQHFINVIEGKSSTEVTKESTLNINKLALLCRESLEKGTAINVS